MKPTQDAFRPFRILSIASIVGVGLLCAAGPAPAEDQTRTDEAQPAEARQEIAQTVRRYEETTTVTRPGVMGEVRTPEYDFVPQEMQRQQQWHNMSQTPGL